MIRSRLNSNHNICVTNVKCYPKIGIGIIFVSGNTQKYALVNTIQAILLDPRKNITISFIEQCEFISYIVFDENLKEVITTEEITHRWAQICQSSNELPQCEQLSVLFPNIFKLTTHSLDDLLTIQATDTLRIKNHFVNIYIRTDCSYFEDLPENITVDEIKSVIKSQMMNQSNEPKYYVQYNKQALCVVVLACNTARQWVNTNNITLKSHIFTKKKCLAFRVIISPVPNSLPIDTIIRHKQFQNNIVKHTKINDKLILELSNKSVYDQCLIWGALCIKDHKMLIDPYRKIVNDPENQEINAENWYETEMLNIKPDILQFIFKPDHLIFKYKWNSQYWLEQFSNVQNIHGKQSMNKKQLLNVSVMLNTIGVIRKKSYITDSRKEIKLKFQQLKTIVYNHRSKLALTREISSIPTTPFSSTKVKVINDDCLVVYTKLVLSGNRPVILNMCNPEIPGGRHRQGVDTQEGNLFRRSDYYLSLDAELDETDRVERYWCTENGQQKLLKNHETMYPMDEFGAIYTSGITLFRDTKNKGYAYLDNPIYSVCAIALAPYQQTQSKQNNPNLLADKYEQGMRKKIENLFAIAYHHGHDCLVLSALGCDASSNTSMHIAFIFKSIIQQYAGYFKTIYFAIIDEQNGSHWPNHEGNYLTFSRILDKFCVQSSTCELSVRMTSGPYTILAKRLEKVTINNVCIFDLPPCRYGGRCSDLNDVGHCHLYSHPPLCFQYDTCDPTHSDDVHDSLFTHLNKCKYAGECQLINDEKHIRQYSHPEFCSRQGDCTDISKDHLLQYRHLPVCRDGPTKCILFRKQDRTHCRSYRHVKLSCEFGGNCIHFHNETHFNERSHPFNPPCPLTPFLCRYHLEFLKIRQYPSREKMKREVDEHCLTFSHVCPLGQQCSDKNELHLRTSIHIERKMCLALDRCFKLTDEEHMNSYSHPKINDIRFPCKYLGSECRDRLNPDHIKQYRHIGNYNQNGVIQYFGLNNNVNFVRNQYKMTQTICSYAKDEGWNISQLNIPPDLIQWIRDLLPIHRCNKLIFESILVHGHVMSRAYMNLLVEPQFVANAVEHHDQVRRIFDRKNNEALKRHGQEFIHALVALKFNESSKKPDASDGTSHIVPNPQHMYTMNTKEVQLKLLLTSEEIATIRTHATNIAQASLNLHANPMGMGYQPDETLGTNKHVFSILGPHLGYYYGDIFLVFKRELMFHPDSNFSIHAATTFGPSCNAYKWRPWLRDPGTPEARIKQFHENKLHCSVLDYEEAAALELMALVRKNKDITNISLSDVQNYWFHADSHQVLEAHLPQLIPLDYIDHVYIPKNIFTELSTAAQQAAKDIFRDRLTVTEHTVDLNSMKVLEENRASYQKYVINEVMKKIAQNKFHSTNGTIITLAPSKFGHHVVTPITISQSYRQYQVQYGPSDCIFIYWQAFGGDMMLTVSNEFINPANEQVTLQCLSCYIAETPSNTVDMIHHESYSYISNHRPYHHDMIKHDRTRMKAMSNSFHRGCDTDDYTTYCLIIRKSTGQALLTHARSNSIYNHQIITYTFRKSELDLNTLDYVHVSAGARILPIRNLIITHEPIQAYHPYINKESKKNSESLITILNQSPANDIHSLSRNENTQKSPVITQDKDQAASKENVSRCQPCPDSINCLLRYSPKYSRAHNGIYSHPCRYSELCRCIPDHPHLEHKPHRVPMCDKDEKCEKLIDPFHRAAFRHSKLSDYLIPCRDQRDCTIKTKEHLIMYSHGENVPSP
ncbi:unnamed protein product [Rotaria sordida]|uniref:C3H1-type domain-containing protein n=1 Tax=Rotaria sordida TaxID=392033 RepID=A0A814X1Q3_9BILA|nr:unnamed protein product [Rotaria sordida]CAF1209017.1 unnamed protein product [Rotaria sordida]